MKITLRKISISESLSEETHAYTAIVQVDGVDAFHASNHGTGGADLYHKVEGYTGPSEAEVSDWLEANTPPMQTHGMSLEYDLELIVGELIEDHLARKYLDRMLKSKIVVIYTKDGEEAVFTYKFAPSPVTIAALRPKLNQIGRAHV